ncbi:putative nucleoredoxin 1-2 [Apium graveolens]|uniref:putative nucleoredoxin 1-2 n=1 Tax=Apium graveolens TaxID=4045 RepID=UPI003D793B2B
MRRSLEKLLRLRGTSSLGTYTSPTTTTSGININRTRNVGSYAKLSIHNCEGNGFKYLEEAMLNEAPKTHARNKMQDPFNLFAQKGDTIDLNDLLFTNERDYLIKNDNQQVKAEDLEGKIVALYFLPLPHRTYDYNRTKWDVTFIMDDYKELQQHNNFEVVLVPISRKTSYKDLSEFPQFNYVDCQHHFDILFSYMPWTAIPFSDVASRERLQNTFGLSQRYIYSRQMLAIVDPMGKVLQYDAWNFFFEYGALGYPFSDERIEDLREEDEDIIKQPSLEKLLASPERDYVISNKGTQVPIHTLEDKVVALYFCTGTKSPYTLGFLEELKLAYEKLAQIKKAFEVVLIYGREFAYSNDSPSEELFYEELKDMPWLALPYRDPSCKKLNRILEISSSNHETPGFGNLVIFDPHAEFIEPFGFNILCLYKIPGYPFTRRGVAQLETERVKDLKLDMICDQNSVRRMKDGSQVPLCQLAGKRILLILEHKEGGGFTSPNANFLMMLKKLYRKVKGTDHHFEVVRVLLGSEESSTSKEFVGRMPWLVAKASEWIHANLASYIWHNRSLDELIYFPVFAFDQDGKLVRKTKYPTIDDKCFPFSGCDLEEEALSQLNTHFEWNYWDYTGGSIYSHQDHKKCVDLSQFQIGRMQV